MRSPDHIFAGHSTLLHSKLAAVNYPNLQHVCPKGTNLKHIKLRQNGIDLMRISREHLVDAASELPGLADVVEVYRVSSSQVLVPSSIIRSSLDWWPKPSPRNSCHRESAQTFRKSKVSRSLLE